jgi:hypothetical protein
MGKRLKSRERNWRTLVSFFPADWEDLAAQTKANVRLRGVQSVEALMQTLLLHLARGYSLRETAVRAHLAGLARVSDVALLKRLRKAEEWLRTLCLALLQEQGVVGPQDHKHRTLRLVDSTTVKEPGKTGSLWRIHYSFRLPEFSCDAFTLTPTKGLGTGDSLTQFAIAPNDHLIADSGYCQGKGIEHVVRNGGAISVRLNPHSLPLFTPHGRRVPLLRRLAILCMAGQVGEWPVHVYESKQEIAGRLCAIRKTEEAIKRAEKRLRRRASKKGEVLQADTLEYAKYVMVFTTFDPITFSAAEILHWYRLRWQIELLFKRLKSLAQLGHLPKADDGSTRAWLYGKLFVALLTEQLIRQGQTLSPCGPTKSSPLPADLLAGVCVRPPPNPAGDRTRSDVTLSPPILEQDCPSINRTSPSTKNAGDRVYFFLKLALMGQSPCRRFTFMSRTIHEENSKSKARASP